MATAVFEVPLAESVPAPGPVPAAARRAIGLVVTAAFITVILGLVGLVVGPRLHAFQGFYVRTSSMSPTIPVGALVVATRASAETLNIGDVIVFERPDVPGMMIVHRIHALEQTPFGRAFITKGDANATPDSWRVTAAGDGWRAVYSVSRAGFVVGWLNVALDRQGLLGVLAVVLAVYALVTIWHSEEL